MTILTHPNLVEKILAAWPKICQQHGYRQGEITVMPQKLSGFTQLHIGGKVSKPVKDGFWWFVSGVNLGYCGSAPYVAGSEPKP